MLSKSSEILYNREFDLCKFTKRFVQKTHTHIE